MATLFHLDKGKIASPLEKFVLLSSSTTVDIPLKKRMLYITEKCTIIPL